MKDTADKHQRKIALDTINLNKVGAQMLGGMTHKEAVAILRRQGVSDYQIRINLRYASHPPEDVDEFMGTLILRLSEKTPTLEEAQAFVGGYVELVTLSDGSLILVNEDGIMKGLPVNPEANKLWGDQVNGNLLGPVMHLTGDARWK